MHVYIDDVCTLTAVATGQVHADAWDSQRMRSVDQFYAEQGIVQSTKKAVDKVLLGGKLWGAEIDGWHGRVGLPGSGVPVYPASAC